MNYNTLMQRLENVSTDNCYPLYVPSVLRPGYHLYTNVIQYLPEWYRKNKVTYLVRKEWYKKYKAAQPDVKIEVIPESYEHEGYGADTTRKCLFDLAYSNGDKNIFDWDDDINRLTFAYGAEHTTRRLRKDDQHKYALNILSLASEISNEAFDKYPRLCLGAISRVTPSTCNVDYHKTKLIINKGPVPRCANIVGVSRMKKHKLERTGMFDKQMEDMGIDFQILEKRGQLFSLPSVIYAVPAMKDNERTEPRIQGCVGNTKPLWDDGLEKLMTFDTGKYVTFTSRNKEFNGDHQPVGINWQKYNKAYGMKSIVEEW